MHNGRPDTRSKRAGGTTHPYGAIQLVAWPPTGGTDGLRTGECRGVRLEDGLRGSKRRQQRARSANDDAEQGQGDTGEGLAAEAFGQLEKGFPESGPFFAVLANSRSKISQSKAAFFKSSLMPTTKLAPCRRRAMRLRKTKSRC